ncbi:hypothetical protein [Salinicola rhizosphaerae]|uniref:Uncharacterized protein n=1 Tax=Salinicola rhizosphaerae TaxID=1443141 RepID=A0ABQ3E386_9GAMM|nr:hypothetical protein [Salinicola rhizosphaerae]GHB24390.1 hypothetical protein GCM10009038_24340 [Salinicola rhizosphaerae]
MNRNTASRAGDRRAHLVLAGAVCFAGTLAMIDADGYVQPGREATGLTAVGVFDKLVDNTGGLSGDAHAEVSRGYFKFDGATGEDEIAAGDIGKPCYAVDAQTVALTDGGGTRSPTGIIDGVDGNGGVWVNVDPTNGVALG